MRRLGGDRAGEMRLFRFLHNPAVTVAEMVATAACRTKNRCQGREILAIQDTTDIRCREKGDYLSLHPTLAMDAQTGSILGLVGAEFLHRDGGKRVRRKSQPFHAKESARWLRGIEAAAGLREAGAADVTVIADRDGDVYEDFALRPDIVHVLIRAAQDRILTDGTRLFEKGDALPEAGRMTVDLPASPGRRAHKMTLSLRFARVEVTRPAKRATRKERAALPENVSLSLVEAREIDPPEGAEPAHWRLLTSHAVTGIEDARRIVRMYRKRWTIEQVFRTLKSKGFDIEALRIRDNEPFEKLATATLIAAITVMQLVHERDGAANRPLGDALDAEDAPILRRISETLEGKTVKQKNPHPPNSLAYVAWVFARLGGWTGYYGKPGPIVLYNGMIQFHTIKHGWKLRDV